VSPDHEAQPDVSADLGSYCRQVEDHLTRVNGGHLVRIVGPGFAVVRQWAEEGIPLSVVRRGIDLKADRHRAGRARRPLRIEFCDSDVRDVWEGWRRAVGLPAGGSDPGLDRMAGARRHPSLVRHLDRVIDRLGRLAGALELPAPVREAATGALTDVSALRDASRQLRGAAREKAVRRLEELDARLLSDTRASIPAAVLDEMAADAERELAPFRDRLSAEAWKRAVAVSVDRRLRDHFGLPVIEF
jgi:hypothetical protein